MIEIMIIPDSIKIGGHVFKVLQKAGSDAPNIGNINTYFQEIHLETDPDPNYPEDRVAETFLHEILEGIQLKNNLKLDHIVLSVLSEGLFQIIRDNGLDFRAP